MLYVCVYVDARSTGAAADGRKSVAAVPFENLRHNSRPVCALFSRRIYNADLFRAHCGVEGKFLILLLGAEGMRFLLRFLKIFCEA